MRLKFHVFSTIAIIILIFIFCVSIVSSEFISRRGWTYESVDRYKVAINPIFFQKENETLYLNGTGNYLYFGVDRICTEGNGLCLGSGLNITGIINGTNGNLTSLTIDYKVNLSSTGDVNATKFWGNYTGTIPCDKITGSPDTDFCTDASAAGGSGTQNGTDAYFKGLNVTAGLNVSKNAVIGGKLGLGTDAPLDKLHITDNTTGGAFGIAIESKTGVPRISLKGDTDIKFPSIAFYDLDNSDTIIGGIILDRSAAIGRVVTGTNQNDFVMYTQADSGQDLHLATEQKSRMIIEDGGNVMVNENMSINHATYPYTLNVGGQLGISNYIRLLSDSNTWILGTTDRWRIGGGGKTLFDMNAGGGIQKYFSINNEGTDVDVNLSNNKFFVSGFTTAVGINTGEPTTTLHVVGNANVTGELAYGSLKANSPHMFMPDESGYSRFCVYDAEGYWNLIYYEAGKQEVMTNNEECLLKEIKQEALINCTKKDKKLNESDLKCVDK